MVLVKPVQGLTDMLLVNMKMKTTQKNTRTENKRHCKGGLGCWTEWKHMMDSLLGVQHMCTRSLWCTSPLRTPSTVCLFTFLIKELLSPPSLPLPTSPFSSLSVPLWFILLLPLFFAKSSLQSFKLHLYFHFSQKNCPSLLSLSTVTPYCCNQSGS